MSKVLLEKNQKKIHRLVKYELIVRHVSRCSREFCIGLDDLVYSIKEILFCSNLPTCSNGIHTSFCADRSDLGTCGQSLFYSENSLLKQNYG